MMESQFEKSAVGILHNLALEYERPWWRRIFTRWLIHDEPLRNDAANLLRRHKIEMPRPRGTRYVGDDEQ